MPNPVISNAEGKGPDAPNSGLVDQALQHQLSVHSEGHTFNDFGAPPDSLSRGLTVHDPMLQDQLLGLPEAEESYPFLYGTGVSYGLMNDQTLQYQLGPQPEGEAYLFQSWTGNAQSYGWASNQTLQHQYGPQLEGANTFPVEYQPGDASSLSMVKGLQQLQLSDQPGSAVNVENPSQISPTPEPPGSSQLSLNRQRKREADRRYNAKKKQRMTYLESENTRLNEENESLKKKGAKLETKLKRQKKEKDHYKRQCTENKAKLDEISKAIVTCQICNAWNHTAIACPHLNGLGN